jgi:hypothetical protein
VRDGRDLFECALGDATSCFAPVAQDRPEIATVTNEFGSAVTDWSAPFVEGVGGAAFELGGPPAAELVCELVRSSSSRNAVGRTRLATLGRFSGS